MVEVDASRRLLRVHRRSGNGYARVDDRLLEDLRCAYTLPRGLLRTQQAEPISGEINVPNLAQPYSAVCSGLTSLLFSGLFTVGVSLARTSCLFVYVLESPHLPSCP